MKIRKEPNSSRLLKPNGIQFLQLSGIPRRTRSNSLHSFTSRTLQQPFEWRSIWPTCSSMNAGRTHSSFQKNSWRNTSSTTTNRNIPLSQVQLSCKNIGSVRPVDKLILILGRAVVFQQLSSALSLHWLSCRSVSQVRCYGDADSQTEVATSKWCRTSYATINIQAIYLMIKTTHKKDCSECSSLLGNIEVTYCVQNCNSIISSYPSRVQIFTIYTKD